MVWQRNCFHMDAYGFFVWRRCRKRTPSRHSPPGIVFCSLAVNCLTAASCFFLSRLHSLTLVIVVKMVWGFVTCGPNEALVVSGTAKSGLLFYLFLNHGYFK